MQVIRSARLLAACVTIAVAMTYASAGRSAIVECTDSRGVSIVSGDADGSGCVVNTRFATRRAARATTLSTSPTTFPRVDPATQRLRDNDRARILKDELDRERQRLVATESRMREVDATAPAATKVSVGVADAASAAELVELLARTRENIRALQAELAGVR